MKGIDGTLTMLLRVHYLSCARRFERTPLDSARRSCPQRPAKPDQDRTIQSQRRVAAPCVGGRRGARLMYVLCGSRARPADRDLRDPDARLFVRMGRGLDRRGWTAPGKAARGARADCGARAGSRPGRGAGSFDVQQKHTWRYWNMQK